MKHLQCILFAIGVCMASCSLMKRSEAGETGETNDQEVLDSVLAHNEISTNPDSLNENFQEFYKRFLSDSTFQISRLLFPLEGEKKIDDQTYAWTPENWTLMRASVYEIDTTEYKVEIDDQEALKSFRIYIPDSGFELIMKFKLVFGKWYLFYCKDMFS